MNKKLEAIRNKEMDGIYYDQKCCASVYEDGVEKGFNICDKLYTPLVEALRSCTDDAVLSDKDGTTWQHVTVAKKALKQIGEIDDKMD